MKMPSYIAGFFQINL